MSQSNPPNPDTRPLPPGWLQQYDNNYKAWYYVNTQEQPSRSSWVHPAGDLAPPPSQYSPPPGGPPSRNHNQAPSYGGGYGGPQAGWGNPTAGGYQSQQHPGYHPQYQPQDESNRGWFGGTQPPPQVVYQQAPPPKHSGMGMGTVLAAGGAALLGGAFLEHEWQEHNEAEREKGYERGYEQGYDQGNGGDGGDGGGDGGYGGGGGYDGGDGGFDGGD